VWTGGFAPPNMDISRAGDRSHSGSAGSRLTMRRSRLPLQLPACARTESEGGFTLVEVLVAILVLAVGVVGTATMALQASTVTGDTKAREGATNLAREVVENILSLPYSSVTPDAITATLQAKPALVPAPGYTGWTVLRRGIPYTVSATECYVDDPSDGRGVHDTNYCSGSTAGTADSKPIDYKRFSVNVAWTRKGITRSVAQSTLVAPKGAKEVPDVTSLTSGSGITITDSSLTSVNFSATTSSSASGVAWLVDEGIRGLATGSGTSWSFSWNISGLPDGQYTIGAKAYNSGGTYGTPMSLTVTLNRAPPAAPQAFVAGYNQTLGTVESEWLASPELDTVGYTVYRLQTAPSLGSVTKVNCGSVASPLYIIAEPDCTDASPIVNTGSGGNITHVGTSFGTTEGATGLTINRPAGVTAGNVMIAVFVIGAKPGVKVPTGWTLIRDTQNKANFEQATYRKVAGSSEPASYTFQPKAGSPKMRGGIVAYSGVDTTTPVDKEMEKHADKGNVATSPSFSTTSNKDQIINAVTFGSTNAGGTITPDSSLPNERYDVNPSTLSHDFADGVQQQAGSTGIKTALPSGSATGWISSLIALKPSNSGSTAMSVNYWVVAVDRDALGAYREGSASNMVNAYATNVAPNPITSSLDCTNNADGSVTLSWSQPSQPGDPDSGDYIAFDRIYRDDVRYDRTGLGTENSFIDPNPGTDHEYYVTTVDTHLAESSPTGVVIC
jgi:prepilin-type N-terminal cleavage/methylation domain-containing protein